MKMSGWYFVVVGLIVGGVSWVMYADGKKMGLFVLAGVAMLVFGLLRVYMDSGTSKESERARLERELPSNNPRKYSLSTIPRVCSTCSAKNNPLANFCGHCGQRL
jgi:sulfite exporter TauE/SafE